MQFFHDNMALIMVGCVFAHGTWTMDAMRDERWGWAVFHFLLGIGCSAYLM
jgi:hypothetical protein